MDALRTLGVALCMIQDGHKTIMSLDFFLYLNKMNFKLIWIVDHPT